MFSLQLKIRILDDAVFSVRVKKMIGILKPIVDLITKLESNVPHTYFFIMKLTNCNKNY